MISPCCASDTRIGQSLLRRLAKAVVKRTGMCWVTRIGGQSEGQAHQQILERFHAAGRGADQHHLAGRPSELRTLGRRRRRDTLVATHPRASGRLHLLLQLAGQGGHLIDHIVRRLGDEIDRADLERLERHLGAGLREGGDITTGIGRSAMILRRKVTPSMSGISTSRVMTSG